jgi:hypothetical protein
MVAYADERPRPRRPHGTELLVVRGSANDVTTAAFILAWLRPLYASFVRVI